MTVLIVDGFILFYLRRLMDEVKLLSTDARLEAIYPTNLDLMFAGQGHLELHWLAYLAYRKTKSRAPK